MKRSSVNRPKHSTMSGREFREENFVVDKVILTLGRLAHRCQVNRDIALGVLPKPQQRGVARIPVQQAPPT